MVNRCSVRGCFTNHRGHSSGAVFKLPPHEPLKSSWIKFMNRDITCMKNVFICYKHFDDVHLNKEGKRIRLNMHLNPIPTSRICYKNSSSTRKPPKSRLVEEDELQKFRAEDTIEDFSSVNESLLKCFNVQKNSEKVTFYRLETKDDGVPEVTECIVVDSHVRLFFRGSSVPLPSWFRKGRNTKLTSKAMLQNLSNHIRKETEESSKILDELLKLRYLKRPIYSANLLRFSLMSRYTSLPAYKLMAKEFNLPCVSTLQKMVSGKLDVSAVAKALKESGSISTDVIVIFDEIYLQKCEEYFGGETFGVDENGEIFKGMLCFMLVGLKSNTPFIIKCVPEREVNGDFVMNNLKECLQCLHELDFNVRGVVCDNHASNVSAYGKLLSEYGNDSSGLHITFNSKRIYLFYNSVHLMKSIRNNLLNQKRFLFPPFEFKEFNDGICVPAGEIRWQIFHRIHEEDKKLDAYLRAAPKITASVIHPGSCKQSVPQALAIFDPTTSAAMERYFPDDVAAARFLGLFYIWWIVSNSKNKFNSSHRLGNAAVLGDKKPQFLRALSDWIVTWDKMKISSSEKFTLSAQTSNALQRTLRCHAALIEDLLQERYDFVLTSRLQSDPIERRFGQYRQMSGGRFLISEKDITVSEKIIKMKSLLKEGLNIDENLKVNQTCDEESDDLIAYLMQDNEIESAQLNEISNEISDHVAGYIAYKMENQCRGCCFDRCVDITGASLRYN